MAKYALKPLTALGHDEPHEVTIGSVTINEIFNVALASLATRKGQEKPFAKHAKTLGLPLAAPNSFSKGKIFSSFWLSPSQWMIEADFAKHENIEVELKTTFGETASITEQSDAWVRFDISASNLQSLIERLCNVDFETAPTLHATRTVVEHIGCYFIKRSGKLVTLYGPRSSAQSLLHALEVTAHAL